MRNGSGFRYDGFVLMSRGELFILSAPSGTGKTTLIRGLLEGGLAAFGGLAFSVSHTTRAPRDAEVDGQDYHFVSEEAFLQMVEEDLFLEWATVHNNYYGTALEEVTSRLDQGIDVLMDIDVQGAERVMALHADAAQSSLGTHVHSIFLMPPTFEDLEERLRKRNLDGAEEIARRLKVSHWEMRRADKYDYAIINDDAKRASDVLMSIILEKRHRRERIRNTVAEIQRDFEQAASQKLVERSHGAKAGE